MHVVLAYYAPLSVSAEAQREHRVPRTNIFRESSQHFFVTFSVFGPLLGSSIGIEESIEG